MFCKKLNNEFNQLGQGSNLKQDWALFAYTANTCARGLPTLQVWEGEIKLIFSVTEPTPLLTKFPPFPPSF